MRTLSTPDNDWNEVGPGTPLNAWLETKCEGEEITIWARCRILCIGDDPEWINMDDANTVTHSTVLPPTHWRWGPHGRILHPTMETTLQWSEHLKMVNRCADLLDRALRAEQELWRLEHLKWDDRAKKFLVEPIPVKPVEGATE